MNENGWDIKQWPDRVIAGMCVILVLMPIANAEAHPASLRQHADFILAEERQRQTQLDLVYEVGPGIRLKTLDAYAEKRVAEICGGDFRYLARDALSHETPNVGGVKHRLVITAECLWHENQ